MFGGGGGGHQSLSGLAKMRLQDKSPLLGGYRVKFAVISQLWFVSPRVNTFENEAGRLMQFAFYEMMATLKKNSMCTSSFTSN
jgi:hypothetical protein